MMRTTKNPILTRSDLPDIPGVLSDATSVFNPGAVKFGERYLLMLRVQSRGRETFLMMAESDDGIAFTVRPDVLMFRGLEECGEEIYHIYDPRITFFEDRYYIIFSADTPAGCRLGIARTEDFKSFDFIGFGTEDVRNGVLFPERINGKIARLERPNTLAHDDEATRSGDEIVLATSTDFLNWTRTASIAQGRPHFWDERIGSGPPPVKTRDGWLHMYHGVATYFGGGAIYQAGVMLLDLADPSCVIARSRNNVLEPRELYEQVGQVPNVVFPSGWIVEDMDDEGFARPDSSVLLYYGAADSCVACATSTIQELVAACYD